MNIKSILALSCLSVLLLTSCGSKMHQLQNLTNLKMYQQKHFLSLHKERQWRTTTSGFTLILKLEKL